MTLQAELAQARAAYARHRVRAEGAHAQALLAALRRQIAAHQAVEVLLAKADIPALLVALSERADADRDFAVALSWYRSGLRHARDAQGQIARLERLLKAAAP